MKIKQSFFLIAVTIMSLFSCAKASDKINLAGEWYVALDSLDVGVTEKWADREFSDKIQLPGTLCDGGYGNACTLQPSMEKEIFLNLKRKYDYVGVAWYRKTVTIPSDWKNKSVSLDLERVIWDSQLWIDGKKVDQENKSLVASHHFDLTDLLTPGKHTLVLRIDNRKQFDISYKDMAHAYTNETQTMWNGVLGEMSLASAEKIQIETLMLTPDVDASKVHVKLFIKNQTSEKSKGKIIFYVKDKTGKALPSKEVTIAGNEISFDYPIENAHLWDEFNPYLYEAVAEWQSGKVTVKKESTFGMRKLTNHNALLQINDKRIFLRGTLECCIFPLKGYPPMTKEEWAKVYRAAQDYGLNHIRFHSWCPPKAAFEMADEMGIYLQVELPLWSLEVGKDEATTRFLVDEADRIIKTYGNHPSFCFWSLGNELQGDFAVMDNLLLSLKKKDSRHLYMTTTFTFEKGHGAWPEPNDDFWVTQWTKKGWVRGQGVFDDQPVNFMMDYSASIDSMPVPVITHEIGQYSVYPNLKEIEKYKGNLIPLNFMAVKEDLKNKGRLAEADDYLKASGKLAVILYKEEIERALKTPGFSGFQLLDLHDFPGQGTALVGLLDAFWETKGLLQPEEFRRFCAPVVPLVRFEKATYTNNETLKVKAEIANFGEKELKGITPVWIITNSKGQTIAQGELPKQDVKLGNAIALGEFSTPLNTINQADKLTLSLYVKGMIYRNSWNIWVYPETVKIDKQEVIYTSNFQEAAKALKEGKKVLLNPLKNDITGLDGKFLQVFWSPVHFPNQPGTMGVLCNPDHPALKDFPTEMHSNWQWWDICKSGKTMVLDSISAQINPIVRMVDNFYKNRNLGLVFEAKVDKGQLLICSADLNTDLDKRPVARQLLFSLLNYMHSTDFAPRDQLAFEQIEKYLSNTTKIEEKKKSIYD